VTVPKKTLSVALYARRVYGRRMELRHLRFFVAVAEEGSLKRAAERRLHTAQPSLSRQIRDIELEVGAQLFERSTRGVELTPAGRSFLDHARLSLDQAAAAVESARRIARPVKPVFNIGVVTGHELDCIPPTIAVLGNDLPDLEVRIRSGSPPTSPSTSRKASSTSPLSGASTTSTSNIYASSTRSSSRSCRAATH
jgi:LysR family transcriptional regulator, hca operon transcriptional activator